MLKKIGFAVVAAVLLASLASAQDTAKGNVFIGAQAIHAGGVTEPGFIGSATLNVAPIAGLTIQASAVRGFGGGSASYAILAGPTFFPIGHRRITPFVNLLGGGAFASSSGGVTPAYFAASVGGGMDAPVGDRFAIRAGADWMHVPAFGASAARGYVGLVIRF